MGVMTGVAAVSLIGFIAALGFSFSGDRSFFGLGKGGAAATPQAQVPTPTAPNEPSAPTFADVKIKDSDYVRGTKGAPVSIVSYSDLECPYCQRFHPSLLQAISEYQGKVAVVLRHFPLSFHQNAQKEAEGAECVGKLGGADKYWKYIDTIFERTTANGTGFALANLPKLAKELGVNEAKFKSCLDGGEMQAKVQADQAEGSGYGVQGTPTTFVNGTAVEGAAPYEQLKAAIDQALKQ